MVRSVAAIDQNRKSLHLPPAAGELHHHAST
jgi:hypothetical protein